MINIKKNLENYHLCTILFVHNRQKDNFMARKVKTSEDQDKEVSFENLLYRVGQNKDRAAYIKIFEHFAPRLKSYLLKQGANEDAAEEVIQDAMIKVWRKAKMYDPSKAKASTWIFTIARNRRIDLLRKGKRSEYLSDANIIEETQSDDEQLSVEDFYVQTEEAQILKSKIDELPDEQMKLLEMAFYEDKTHQEIAEETQIPLGTVKSRIRLALGKLRKKIAGTAL